MKKYILFLLAILILNTVKLSAEWKQVYDDPDSIAIELAGFDCIGDHCVNVMKWGWQEALVNVSSDRGKNWEVRVFDSLYFYRDKNGDYIYDSTTKEYLYHKPYYFRDVECVSDDFWIATCDSGYYYISHDAFETWELLNFKRTNYISVLTFIDDSVGIMGNTSNLYLTFDQCQTWENISPDLSELPEKTWIDDVCWTPEGGIYVTTFSWEKKSVVFYSADSGKTYNQLGWTFGRMFDLHFFNDEVGIGVGRHTYDSVVIKSAYNVIYKTTNGGMKWKRVLYKILPSKTGLGRVEFYDENKGVAYQTYSWDYWVTTDGGDTWERDTTYDLAYDGKKGLNSNLNYMCFLDNGDLIGQNNYGTVWRQDFLTSVKETEAFGEIRIYPNPIPRGGTATISLDIDHPGMYSFSVYSLDGSLLDSYQTFLHTAQNTIEYQPENLPRGNYFLVISGGGGEASVKLVIK